MNILNSHSQEQISDRGEQLVETVWGLIQVKNRLLIIIDHGAIIVTQRTLELRRAEKRLGALRRGCSVQKTHYLGGTRSTQLSSSK